MVDPKSKAKPLLLIPYPQCYRHVWPHYCGKPAATSVFTQSPLLCSSVVCARLNARVALNGPPTTELQDVNCHIGSHSITCHPTQVNAPHPNPSPQAGTRFTYPGGTEGWVDLGYPAIERQGVELANSQFQFSNSQVRRPNHYTTKPHRVWYCKLWLTDDWTLVCSNRLNYLTQRPVHYNRSRQLPHNTTWIHIRCLL